MLHWTGLLVAHNGTKVLQSWDELMLGCLGALICVRQGRLWRVESSVEADRYP